MSKSYTPTMTRLQCQRLASIVATGDTDKIRRAFRKSLKSLPIRSRGTWGFYFAKFVAWLNADMPSTLPFAAYKKGNSKLPFLAFSTLPGVTCPGAGECLKWCYSFRAWRYPAAFLRQCQNTILMQSDVGRSRLVNAFRSEVGKHNKQQRRSVAKGNARKELFFRLYVDGDFATPGDIVFWFDLLQSTPSVLAYGYSKSWQLIQNHADMGGTLPDNYLLNLSSGSVHESDATLKESLLALPITRGEFIGVPLTGRYAKGFARFDDSSMHAEVRALLKKQAPGQKSFSCSGQCGTCTPIDHACGSDRFRGVLIGIGIHG